MQEPPPNTTANNECDTNADTCCLGTNFIVLACTNRVADVYAYDKSVAPVTSVPIVTGATAYEDPDTGRTYILLVHEGLYYGSKLDHSLINPNQLRYYGVPVWDNPFDTVRGLRIDADEDVSIPLRSEGTKVLFTTRTPTLEELHSCTKIHLTSQSPWEPTTVQLGQIQQLATRREQPRVLSEYHSIRKYEYVEPDSNDADLHSIDPTLTNLGRLLDTTINTATTISSATTEDPTMEDIPSQRTYVSTQRHTKLTADALAEHFCIGPRQAYQTLKVTTQKGLRSATLPISRRYRSDRMFGKRTLRGKFATDTLYAYVKSLNSNIGSQVYTHKCGFVQPYHLKKADGDQIGFTLSDFTNDYGVPEQLTFDGAMNQKGHRTKFMDIIRREEIKFHISSPRRPNENPAEGSIREMKKRWYRVMHKKNAPPRLWDYGISWVCETYNITANNSRYSNGRTPMEIITGDTPEISEYLDFGFYDWVIFRQNSGLGAPELGRWLGVSHRVGRAMSYWILPPSGIPVSCVTVQRVTNMEKTTDEMIARVKAYDDGLQSRWEAKSADISNKTSSIANSRVLWFENEDADFMEEYNRIIDDTTLPHADDLVDTVDVESDNYINMEIGLPHGADGELAHARVKRRATDAEGRPIGRANNNFSIDTRQYEVEFLDGTIERLTANIIAENLLAQVDEEGRRQMMLYEIVDHRIRTDAIPKSAGTYIGRDGHTRKKRTTRGWEILVQWKDGSHDWIELKDMKESYPVELAQYAINNNISDEPAFAWWVPHVLKKRDAIVKKVKSKYWQRTHKYGIRVPKNVKEAKEIDAENGNALWMDAMRLEMANVRTAFTPHEGDTKDLVGYKEITGHLVFDVKLGENFRRKARYCADGHKTDAPASITHSSVVSRDSVRMLLTIAALNGLEALGADTQNAFLTAPTKEKIWIRAGPEFGSEEGKVMVVTRALHGLKSASASFRSYMASKLDDMGFKSSVADPDAWMRPAKKASGDEYYEYALMHVDDILAMSMKPEHIMECIKSVFKFKGDKYEKPSNYLGGLLSEKKSLSGATCWSMTSVEYVNAAIKNVEEAVQKRSMRIPINPLTPMVQGYLPEYDESDELDASDTQFFQELIGILRWATELGRVDMLHEVAILSQYQASPRMGHLVQLLRIFGYLKKKPKISIYFDSDLPNFDRSLFSTKKEDFHEHYRDAKEDIPHGMPKPRGTAVTISGFVDASHAANKKTRKSHSGYVLFVNRAPVLWHSKRQQTVETSAFSSEFIAMKVCVEAMQHLRFKLRMFGVPVEEDEPAYLWCDNEAVVKNTTKVESVLNKKSSSVAYHYVRWAVAAGIVSVAWIPTDQNLADTFTKRLAEAVRDRLFGQWIY